MKEVVPSWEEKATGFIDVQGTVPWPPKQSSALQAALRFSSFRTHTSLTRLALLMGEPRPVPLVPSSYYPSARSSGTRPVCRINTLHASTRTP